MNDLSITEKEENNESGQAVVEYVVILAVAVSIALPLSKQLLGFIDGTVARLGSTLERKLYTGRTPVNVWRR
ncbi:MAG: hypothetical protein KA715_04475 [Xanthomonadaceae bacterium]|nr:hypothetical protein [Xanthomonadaceae bacterium]